MHKNHTRTFLVKPQSKLMVVLILLFVSSFALRVFRLDFYSLWYDEVNTALLVQPDTGGSALSKITGTTGSETLHPLYYLMLSAWVKLVGNSPWTLRFPSVVLGACAVVVYAIMLYRVMGRKGLGFSLLFVIAPFLVWYSRDARPYSLIMFLTGLHLLFYLSLIEGSCSKVHLAGLLITGVLSIYSGIFVGMLLVAELIWSLLRRRVREAVAVLIVLIFASPLVLHGYRTFFHRGSERHRDLPTGISATRIIGFPQELFVARSLGPTPDEIRRFPLGKVVQEKLLELGAEVIAAICIIASLAMSVKSHRKADDPAQHCLEIVHALGFISVTIYLQAAMIIAITGYQMNARHIGLTFGPIFVTCFYLITRAEGFLSRVLFFTPLLVLWTWSSGNQFFNPAYVPDDFKNVAKIIETEQPDVTRVVALCHGRALRYYGVKKHLIYFMESPEVTIEKIKGRLEGESSPVWLVLGRPWAYPNFRAEDLGMHFRVLDNKQLPGITMWLLSPINYVSMDIWSRINVIT